MAIQRRKRGPRAKKASEKRVHDWKIKLNLEENRLAERVAEDQGKEIGTLLREFAVKGLREHVEASESDAEKSTPELS